MARSVRVLRGLSIHARSKHSTPRRRTACGSACAAIIAATVGLGCSGSGTSSGQETPRSSSGDRIIGGTAYIGGPSDRGGAGLSGAVVPNEPLRSAAITLDRRSRLIEPLVGRVRAEPGSTVLVPVRLAGPIDTQEPIRLMVVRPGVVWSTTAADDDEQSLGTGLAYATLHRWSVTGGGGVPMRDGSAHGGTNIEAARWLGLTGKWSVSSDPRVDLSAILNSTDGVVGGAGGWLLAINVPWSEDQERGRREVVFPGVLLEVRGFMPRSRSLDLLSGSLSAVTPAFDASSASGADLLSVLRSWPTERWRATLLTLGHANTTPTPGLGGMRVDDGGVVLEALSQQIESSWLAALASVARDDALLASRLRDRLVLRLRGLDGVSSIPAWPADSQSLDQLLDDLLNDTMPANWRLERARGWLDMQPTVAAWVTSDAYAVTGVDHHPVSGVLVAALSPTAGSFAGSRAGVGVAPAVLTLRSKSGVGGASTGETGSIGASFIALEFARMVAAEVELSPTNTAGRPFTAGREVGTGITTDSGTARRPDGGISAGVGTGIDSGNIAERLEFGGVEGFAARAAMDAGIGDVVELTSGEWSMSRRVWGRGFPVTRPGVTLGPWRAESRMASWLSESTRPSDDRAVELGFGPVSGIAGLPGRTGATGGAAGTVGSQSVHDPGWVTAARIYKDPQQSSSGWVVYVECRGVGDDTGERGAAQRSAVVRSDTVRIIFGPGAGASHIVAVTDNGVEASYHVPTAKTSEREATIVRHADGWSAWIDVPASAIDSGGILRVGFERVDARGLRSTWPRTCTPWCDDPGRASFDLRMWGDSPADIPADVPAPRPASADDLQR